MDDWHRLDEECRTKARDLLKKMAAEGMHPGVVLQVLRYAAAHLHNVVPDHQQESMKRATVEAMLLTAQEVHDGQATHD